LLLASGNSSVASGPIVVFLLQVLRPPITIEGTAIISGSFNASNFINNYTGMPFSTILTNMGRSNVSPSPPPPLSIYVYFVSQR